MQNARRKQKMTETIRTEIDVNEKAGYILDCLKQGILLTTKENDLLDTMTIGWATIGIDWSIPVFTVYVRESRFTKVLLDKTNQFTVNIPLPGEDVRKILSFCGTRSGRDTDKFKELNLHTVPGLTVDVPAIVELPLTIECEVLYVQEQDPRRIPDSILQRHYPNKDFHTAYYARITAAYILEEEK